MTQKPRMDIPRRFPHGRLRNAALCCLAFFSLAAHAADPNPPSIHSDRGAWPICRQWTLAETRHFADWIRHIHTAKSEGTRAQRLARLERVLTDPEINLLLDPEFAGDGANPQLDSGTIHALNNVLDCAKLTVTLGAYYAYMRGLPWMYGSVRASDGGDVRTAAHTLPAGVASSFEYRAVGDFFRDAVTITCTGNYRVELNRDNSERSDTVPVAITPRHLIPGSLYYLDGHVLVLARINPDGDIRFLDATTSPTRDIYTFNGLNAVTGLTAKQSGMPGREYEGCYRGFRIHRWPVAEVDAHGAVTGVRRRTDAEMGVFGFSTEQYDRLEELATAGGIVEDGLTLGSFHQFVRMRLRTAGQFNLSAIIRAYAAEMAALLAEREMNVRRAWREVTENGPVPFPEDRSGENVFTAGGRWGDLATALDDTGLRARYFEFADHLDDAISWFDLRAGKLNLDGFNRHAVWSHADLAAAVLREKDRLFADTPFEYENSAGQPVRLSLLDVEKRLFDLSFDPNHPPELRWGAPPGSPEALSAAGPGTPLPGGGTVTMEDAYQREAYYRSLTHWEPEPSSLREMFTRGFPVRDKLDMHLRHKWFDSPSPPLVPRNPGPARAPRNW